MLTDTNCSTCCGTLFLIQEITAITVITVKTFEKTQLLLFNDQFPINVLVKSGYVLPVTLLENIKVS